MSRHSALAEDADWRRLVSAYVGANARRAWFQLVTTLGPLAAGVWAVHALRTWSLPLALVAAVGVAGLFVRTFVLMHDCAHASFFRSRRLNDAVGVVTGLLTLTPFAQWRRDHALHHASSGDLDRRGHGDVPTLTVREYRSRSPRGRLAYRIIRHRAALLLGGPFHLALGQRYWLQQCHDANVVLQRSPTITLRSGTAALRLTLWDEDQRRLVGFRDVTLT